MNGIKRETTQSGNDRPCQDREKTTYGRKRQKAGNDTEYKTASKDKRQKNKRRQTKRQHKTETTDLLFKGNK